MGRKGGENPKVTAAREREEALKAEKDSRAAKEKDDKYWKEAGEGSKSKAQAKKEEQEKQRQEALAKKQEARLLAEKEEAEVVVKKAPKAKPTTSKMTQYQLNQQRELEQKMKEQQLKEKELAVKREVSEGTYSKLVETQNVNRQDDVIEASGLDQVFNALVVGDEPAVDKHPEKRMRAAWLAFEAREMPILKQEKPGLKLNQYRDLLWKMWQKSPDNPMNQAKAAA